SRCAWKSISMLLFLDGLRGSDLGEQLSRQRADLVLRDAEVPQRRQRALAAELGQPFARVHPQIVGQGRVLREPEEQVLGAVGLQPAQRAQRGPARGISLVVDEL